MTAQTQAEESDFSIRKMKIAFAILVGTLFGSSILPFMAIGLLTLPMTEEFGWTRTQFSGGLTSMMLVGSISAPFLGRLVDKIGVRRMIIGGTFVVGLITMALSQQDGSLWQFYAGFAILGFAGTTAIGYSKVIGALFNKHRGKALAIFGVESSIAGAFAPKLIQYFIDDFGWRGMFVGLGLIILSVIPVLLIWLKEPEASKQDGASAGAAAEPPGMIDGPSSAPSSPPEMPAPTKLMPVSRTARSRRMVSVKSALPPSTMMSPGSNTLTSSSMTASVARPACTMMIAVRGVLSDSAKSA